MFVVPRRFLLTVVVSVSTLKHLINLLYLLAMELEWYIAFLSLQ